jgi:uncharacterized repeat protein (TIGR01451 family)
MRKTRSIFVCVAVMAAGLVAFAAPVAATELGNRTFVGNTDFASFGVGGMRGSGSETITVAGVAGTVSKALLYWSGPTDGTTSNAAVNFDGTPITGTDIGTSDNNCWGFNDSRSYRANVTSNVDAHTGGPNGTYPLSGFTKTSGDPEFPTVDADANGASLIVFFDDGNQANNRDVTMVEGNDSNVDNPSDSAGWDSTITNVQYQSGVANLQLHVSDGQSFNDDAVDINGAPFLPAGQNFDGDSVPGTFSGNGEGVTGNLWDLKDYANISSFLDPGSNDLTLTSGLAGDCLSLVVALVDVPSPAANLSVAKSDSPDPVKAGNVLSYTIDVANAGPSDVANIDVDDTFPAQLSGVSWTCSIRTGTGSCAAGSGSGTINTTVNLNNGATARFFVTGTVNPGATGSLSNTATIASPADTTPGNNSDTETTAITASTTANTASGFCSEATPCTISTDTGTGATPGDPTVSTLSIPSAATAEPQSITLVESSGAGTFCGGSPCQGQIVTITSSSDPNTFAGVTDPNHPAVLTMVFDKTVKQGSQVYIKKGTAAPKLVKNCTTAGIAIPHPCVSAKNIVVGSGDRAFIILFLAGDPIIGKR